MIIWWLFGACIVIFLLALTQVDWGKNGKPNLDEIWMLEDDMEEADE
jgi:hypothetical protein